MVNPKREIIQLYPIFYKNIHSAILYNIRHVKKSYHPRMTITYCKIQVKNNEGAESTLVLSHQSLYSSHISTSSSVSSQSSAAGCVLAYERLPGKASS